MNYKDGLKLQQCKDACKNKILVKQWQGCGFLLDVWNVGFWNWDIQPPLND